jgi:26S proteasome regulatory subunit N9
MKALSLGLIRGSMDEVDGTIDVSWVQPRVLDTQQLQLLSSQFQTWGEKVKEALMVVEEQTPELYV